MGYSSQQASRTVSQRPVVRLTAAVYTKPTVHAGPSLPPKLSRKVCTQFAVVWAGCRLYFRWGAEFTVSLRDRRGVCTPKSTGASVLRWIGLLRVRRRGEVVGADRVCRVVIRRRLRSVRVIGGQRVQKNRPALALVRGNVLDGGTVCGLGDGRIVSFA